VFYAWDIIIPKNTPENDPIIQTLKLTKGVITKLSIKFPPGCKGLVKTRIIRYESQLVPLSRGEWLTGDGETIPTETYYPIRDEPTSLKFIGCSPNTYYPHKITVRIQLTPEWIATPWQVMKDFVSVIKKLIGL